MNTREAFQPGINMGQFLVEAYLNGLSDADLLVRAVPGTNHIAWQLGHAIESEHDMIEAIVPGSMPELPAGFRERHTKDKAKSDNPQDFFKKDEYLKAFNEQRAGTLKALARMSDADFDKPSPEPMQSYAKNLGEVFSMQGTHWVMHAAQWALIRRKLGHPPLF